MVYSTKKGEVGVLIVLALMIVGIGFFALKEGDWRITGAATYRSATCGNYATKYLFHY